MERKIIESKPMRATKKFLSGTLRNCGYNNYSAIADIIDNSVEPDVEATDIEIITVPTGKSTEKTTESILIIDNGCGMDFKTLHDALNLGSDTGKEATKNLGLYGTGLKSAALSIGKTLTVLTKQENDKLYVAIADLEKAQTSCSDDIPVDYCEPSDDDSVMFKKHIKCDHGTIVIISNLDRLCCQDYYAYRNTIINKIGSYFYYIIKEGGKTIKVNGAIVEPKNPIGDNVKQMSPSGSYFEFENQSIRYNAYFVPRTGLETDTNGNRVQRTAASSGFYIYRQNRLVSNGALGLGLLGNSSYKDTWYNGFRCEIFIDGTCDTIFNTSFNKMINESDGTTINTSFRDKLKNEIGPYLVQARSKERELSAASKENKELKKKLDKIAEKQNKNQFLNVEKTFGINEKPNNPREKNPNPVETPSKKVPHNRHNGWFGGYILDEKGEFQPIYTTEYREDGKVYCVINTSHIFYTEFLAQHQDDDVIENIAKLWSCQYPALKECGYYTNPDIQNAIDEYNSQISERMRKSMKY